MMRLSVGIDCRAVAMAKGDRTLQAGGHMTLKEKLIKKGYSQTRLANELGVKQPTISAIVSGKGRSQHVERRITEITGHEFPPNKRIPQSLQGVQ